MRKLRSRKRASNRRQAAEEPQSATQQRDPQGGELLSAELSVNEHQLEAAFSRCSDFVLRKIYADGEPKILIAYIDGLIDIKTLDETLLEPLTFGRFARQLEEGASLKKLIEDRLIAFSPIQTTTRMAELVSGVLAAKVAVVVEGEAEAAIAELKGFEKRAIEEPTTERVIRGPKEAFNESLQTNTSMIRRRIRSSRLKMEKFTVGTESRTDVVMAYLEGMAPASLVEEVRHRISSIHIDAVLDSAYIEEMIEDAPFSPFPQIFNTERPDVVASGLLSGKVAVLVDNTPFALVMPMTFWAALHAPEDYYDRFVYTFFLRTVRFIMFGVALFLPSIYVALSTFHPELIPTNLLISIATAREGIPFPAVIEALLMEFVFEGLREAGVRLPKAVGSAVSIVGALVIGEAAVQAGIVSAPMIIVVAATGIASFVIPRHSFGLGVRVIRFALLILAGMFGLYGVVAGFIALSVHLVNLDSFGSPYFLPAAPQTYSLRKDFIFRAPRWTSLARRKNPQARERKPG